MTRDLESIKAIIAAVNEATEKERQRCLDIISALKSDEAVWDDEFDGCSGPGLVDAACDELVRRIEAES